LYERHGFRLVSPAEKDRLLVCVALGIPHNFPAIGLRSKRPFQQLRRTPNAENDRSEGAAINVITKAGTNDYGGRRIYRKVS
jgi:hypothetical protein